MSSDSYLGNLHLPLCSAQIGDNTLTHDGFQEASIGLVPCPHFTYPPTGEIKATVTIPGLDRTAREKRAIKTSRMINYVLVPLSALLHVHHLRQSSTALCAAKPFIFVCLSVCLRQRAFCVSVRSSISKLLIDLYLKLFNSIEYPEYQVKYSKS
jgi:hypothetical protein